jgi:hypothetical protein
LMNLPKFSFKNHRIKMSYERRVCGSMVLMCFSFSSSRVGRLALSVAVLRGGDPFRGESNCH